MQVFPESQLQLLLFVDDRPSSRQQVQEIRDYLKQLQADYQFSLQTIDVGEQPYLAEQFKLVATPALIKIHPSPRQTLAGSNLISQIKSWWTQWQAIASPLELTDEVQAPLRSMADSAELLRLADEVFCLKQEKEKLIEQLQFKDRVIAMLAHDLRNPLTAVSIAVETLESNYHVAPGNRMTPALANQLFKQARSQTRVMEQMITSLLQVSQSTTAQLNLQPQKIALGPICQDAIAQLHNRFEAKSQQIEQDIPQDLPHVYGDPDRVHQVLINLLDNAIKYTPPNGVIKLCCFHRTIQKIQISISDTGPGIPEQERDRIFTEHFRLSRDENKDGYGIGLSLCRQVIRAHYGEIWVDGSSGSCFHFTLPVYPR